MRASTSTKPVVVAGRCVSGRAVEPRPPVFANVGAPRRAPEPVCLEGARACPPDDVGGTWGYEEFLEAMADPGHERHEDLLAWIGGSFDPDEFDPAATSQAIMKGLPDWRSERRL